MSQCTACTACSAWLAHLGQQCAGTCGAFTAYVKSAPPQPQRRCVPIKKKGQARTVASVVCSGSPRPLPPHRLSPRDLRPPPQRSPRLRNEELKQSLRSSCGLFASVCSCKHTSQNLSVNACRAQRSRGRQAPRSQTKSECELFNYGPGSVKLRSMLSVLCKRLLVDSSSFLHRVSDRQSVFYNIARSA